MTPLRRRRPSHSWPGKSINPPKHMVSGGSGIFPSRF
nr:MAG TPA: hypothetical protein [Caudoviricetes sp.]